MYKVSLKTVDGVQWLGYHPTMGYETFVEESVATVFDEPMTIDSPLIEDWIHPKNVLTVESKEINSKR